MRKKNVQLAVDKAARLQLRQVEELGMLFWMLVELVMRPWKYKKPADWTGNLRRLCSMMNKNAQALGWQTLLHWWLAGFQHEILRQCAAPSN
jgi:hypothetical protein